MKILQGSKKDVVDTLCEYFNCRIEDLFEYVPDEHQKNQ
ncbi:MAG: helix-turn-helix domain-containing protein [Methylobacter sp.]